MGRIKDDYERLKRFRSIAEYDAYESAIYTLDPGISSYNGNYGESVGTGRYNEGFELVSSFGASIVRNLASTITAIIFPSKVPFLALDFMKNDSSIGPTTDELDLLAAQEKRMLRHFDALRGKSAISNAILYSIPGCCAVIHFASADEDDNMPERIRMFPLRSFVTEYRDNFLMRIIIHEEIFGFTESGSREKTNEFYTEINYGEKTVKQENKGSEKDTDDSVKRWILISNEQPYVGRQYPSSFVKHHIDDIRYLNVLKRSFRDITANAANQIIGVRPGSGIDYTQLAKLRGPVVVPVRSPDDIFSVNLNSKLNEAGVVLSTIQRIEQMLRREFLQGLFQNSKNIETAAEVQQIKAEMDAIDDHFFSHHVDFTQQPIAEALLDMEGIGRDGNNGKIEPVILTGVKAITQQESAQVLFRIYTAILSIDPTFSQKVPTDSMFKRLADSHHIETSDLFVKGSDFMDLIKKLVEKVKEDPQNTVPVLLQIIKPFLPQGAMDSNMVAAQTAQVANGLAAANGASPNATPQQVQQQSQQVPQPQPQQTQ